MTVFVDASALTAIRTGEDETDALADRLEVDDGRLCSALPETVARLCRSYSFSVPTARDHVRLFVDLAAEAYAQFGKGRHPAALNMGDCFAYACAKSTLATLLYRAKTLPERISHRVAQQRFGQMVRKIRARGWLCRTKLA